MNMDEEFIEPVIDSHRFFAVSPKVYEDIRLYLDSSFGHPLPHTITCIPPIDLCHRDFSDRVMVSASHDELAKQGVKEQVKRLLDLGLAFELSREDYDILIHQDSEV